MKKTEKIELRVSHEEKVRLSNIADRRSQTVSDVVREALSGELGTPPARYPRWPGVLAVGAILLSSVSLIWMAINPAIGDAERSAPIMSTVTLLAGDEWRDGPPITLIKTQIAHQDEFSQNYIFQREGETYEISHTVEETGRGVHLLKMDICRKQAERCDRVDQGQVTLSRPSAYTQLGVVKFFDKSEVAFTANIQPTALPRPIAGES